MINLLPPAAKRDFTAGRVNALLVRYIWITLALFGLLAVLCGLTLVMLEDTKQAAQQQIASNDADVASLTDIQIRADSFRANLAISKAILDQQTHYTDTLLKISGLMMDYDKDGKPAVQGTVLNNISLDQSAYGTPMNLQIFAKNEDAAFHLKSNFQSSPMFKDVHFQSLSMGSDSSTDAAYPVSGQLIVTINKEGL